MADAMIKAAVKIGIDINFYGRPLKNYKRILVFENRPSEIPPIDTKGKIGLWQCDLRKTDEIAKPRIKIDYTFLCNSEYIPDYKKHYGETYYMPQCGLDRPIIQGRAIDWDISFIGNFSSLWHHNRSEIIEALKSEFSVKIIAGERFTKDSGWIYQQSPFNLSISLPVGGYTSNRTYNILASGGFCLINYFPEIEKLFENHKHLVWFKTPREAVELVDYYYKHPAEYEAIKREGFKLYNSKHTAERRLSNMFEIMSGKTNEFQGYK